MAAMIRDREISVAELVDAHFQEIHRVNGKLNAFVSIDEERARRQATLARDWVRAGDEFRGGASTNEICYFNPIRASSPSTRPSRCITPRIARITPGM